MALILNVGGAALTIDGTDDNDNFEYTPTGANAGSVNLNGQYLTTNFFNVGAASAFTIDGLGGINQVTVDGTAANDVIGVVRGVSDTVQVNALQTVTLPSADTQSLVVASGFGDDTVNVSGTGGPPVTVLGGQAPSSLILNVINTLAGSTVVTPGADNDSGTVVSPDGIVHFDGVGSVSVTAAAAADVLTINGTNGDDTITTENLGGHNIAWVNAQAPVTYSGFATLILNGRFGDNTFSISPVGLAGVTAIQVNGDNVPNSDLLVVNGTTSADNIGYTLASTPGVGTVSVDTSAPITFTAIAGLTINGQGGGDALTVTTVALFDQDTLTPGSAIDAGTLTFTALANPVSDTPLSYSNLGSSGSLTIADGTGSRFDTLVYNGTWATIAST